jgi:hypothetical protein
MSPYEFVSVNIAYVALLVSILALVLSGATIYFTFFHTWTSMTGLLVTYGKEEEGLHDRYLEYALSNTGNVQLILNRVTVMVSRDLTKGFDSLPVTIEPGTAKLVRVRFALEEARWAIEHKHHCLVDFQFLSSRGKRYQASHDFQPTVPEPPTLGTSSPITFGGKEWKPFRIRRTKI